jgi:hypothetical protein
VLLSGLPQHGLAGPDRLRLAVRPGHPSLTADDGEELPQPRGVPTDASACRDGDEVDREPLDRLEGPGERTEPYSVAAVGGHRLVRHIDSTHGENPGSSARRSPGIVVPRS